MNKQKRGKYGADLLLTVNEPKRGVTREIHARDDWILDSGSSRHLVNDEAILFDSKDCNHTCNMANGEMLVLTKVGSVRLQVIATGFERTINVFSLDH